MSFFRRRRALTALGALAVGAVVLVYALPHAAAGWARRALDRHPAYDGDFRALDIDLIAGRAALHDVVIKKRGEKEGEPFVQADCVHARVHWIPLLKKEVIGDLLLESPQVHIVARAVEEEKEKTKEVARKVDVSETLRKIVPFRVDRFEIRGGTVTYRNPVAAPPINVRLDAVSLVVENLANTDRLSGRLPASAELRARLMESGGLGARMEFDPVAPSPLFTLDFRLRDLELAAMNDFMRHYAGIDAARGRLTLVAEVSAKDGRYEGYLKPLLEGFEMRSERENHPGPAAAVKEWAVEKLEGLFENETTQASGSRVPFEGRLRSPSVDVWTAAVEVFKNAFLQALGPGIEGRQSFGDPE